MAEGVALCLWTLTKCVTLLILLVFVIWRLGRAPKDLGDVLGVVKDFLAVLPKEVLTLEGWVSLAGVLTIAVLALILSAPNFISGLWSDTFQQASTAKGLDPHIALLAVSVCFLGDLSFLYMVSRR